MIRLIVILLLLSLAGHAEQRNCNLFNIKMDEEGCVSFYDYNRILNSGCENVPSCISVEIKETGEGKFYEKDPDLILDLLAQSTEFLIDERGYPHIKDIDLELLARLKLAYEERGYFFDDQLVISEIYYRFRTKDDPPKPKKKEYFKKENDEEKKRVIQVLDSSAFALLKNPKLKDIKIIFYNKNGRLSDSFMKEAEQYLLEKGVSRKQFQIKIVE